MRRVALVLSLLLPIPVFGQTVTTSKIVSSNPPPLEIRVPPHVVSVSKQITVFSDDQGLAASLTAFGDKVKLRLLDKLALKDTWQFPVVIAIRTNTNAPTPADSQIQTSIFRIGRGLKYELDCNIPPPLSQEQFVRELVQLLCLEIANRQVKLTADTIQLAVPPLWFTEGLTQNLLGNVQSVELELLERDLEVEKAANLRALFKTEKLPPTGIERELFKAKCKMLIRGLNGLPDGARRVRRFLTSLQPGVSWNVMFSTQYQDVLPNDKAAEAWWTKQLKVRTGPSPQNRLSARESEEQLMTILTMEAVYNDPATGHEKTKQVTLLEMQPYLDKPGTNEMLLDRIHRLVSLQIVAHQSYVPVIRKYVEVLHYVRLDAFRKARPSLREADSMLAATRKQTTQIAASLDKMEAAQVNRDLLFLYRDYFQTFDEIKKIEQSRDNAIKNHLDRFQQSQTNAPPAPKQ